MKQKLQAHSKLVFGIGGSLLIFFELLAVVQITQDIFYLKQLDDGILADNTPYFIFAAFEVLIGLMLGVLTILRVKNVEYFIIFVGIWYAASYLDLQFSNFGSFTQQVNFYAPVFFRIIIQSIIVVVIGILCHIARPAKITDTKIITDTSSSPVNFVSNTTNPSVPAPGLAKAKTIFTTVYVIVGILLILAAIIYASYEFISLAFAGAYLSGSDYLYLTFPLLYVLALFVSGILLLLRKKHVDVFISFLGLYFLLLKLSSIWYEQALVFGQIMNFIIIVGSLLLIIAGSICRHAKNNYFSKLEYSK